MASTVHVFKVEMTCEGCSGAIEKILGRLKGTTVDDFSVSLPDQKVTVTSKLSADELLAIIKKAGVFWIYCILNSDVLLKFYQHARTMVNTKP